MPRSPDSAQLDLADVFRLVQRKMLADLDTSGVFEHPTANGTATEQIWITLFAHYLPKRYRAAPAFIINSSGRRSRQIDIAIFDNLHSPPLFPHTSGDHIPIESVYAVFEVKPTISKQFLEDAGEKAASVRILTPTKRKILAGLLATSSVWSEKTYPANLTRALESLPKSHNINLGCALEHGSFANTKQLAITGPDKALIFFLLHLITNLNALGQAPEPDLLDYLNRA